MSSTLYKSTAVGLFGKANRYKPVDGATCSAMIALEIATDFFTGHPKDPMVKVISTRNYILGPTQFGL